LKHGARSERVIAPLAERARSELIEIAPWLAAEAFAPSIAAWSRAEARVTLISEWLKNNGGMIDGDGEPKSVVDLLLRCERLAMELRTRLGLDPNSLAKLQRDLGEAARSWNLTKLMEEGQAARRRGEEAER
jgi:hypothetical protein